MTTEEKLQVFYENSLSSASEEAEKIVNDYRAALDQLYQEHLDEKKRQKEIDLADEKERLKRENNKALSAEQLRIRHSLSVKTLEITSRIFTEVEEKLAAFRKTPEYISFLCQKIKEAQNSPRTKGAQIKFFLDASDQKLMEEVSAKAGVFLNISPDPIDGGLIAVVPDKNILIDNSFASMMNEARNSFTFEGGNHNV